MKKILSKILTSLIIFSNLNAVTVTNNTQETIELNLFKFGNAHKFYITKILNPGQTYYNENLTSCLSKIRNKNIFYNLTDLTDKTLVTFNQIQSTYNTTKNINNKISIINPLSLHEVNSIYSQFTVFKQSLVDNLANQYEVNLHPKIFSPLCSTLQEKITKLVSKINFIREVRAFKCNSNGVAWCHQNIVSELTEGPIYIFINENELNEYNSEEQDFIILHELSHILHHHESKRNYLNFGLQFIRICCGALAYKFYQPNCNNEFLNSFGKSAVFLTVLTLLSPLHLAIYSIFSKIHEKNADSYAFKIQKCIPTACSVMEKFKSFDPKSKLSNLFFGTHPLAEDRIKNLKSLALKLDVKVKDCQ